VIATSESGGTYWAMAIQVDNMCNNDLMSIHEEQPTVFSLCGTSLGRPPVFVFRLMHAEVKMILLSDVEG
jgi:hypothetical protein